MLNSNKASSDEHIREKVNTCKKDNHKIAATYHPDKVPDSNRKKSEKTCYFMMAKDTYDKQVRVGQGAYLSELKSMSASPGARGHTSTDELNKVLEDKLMERCVEKWDDGHHVMRGFVFCKVMELSKGFLGKELSRRKVNSMGQKLRHDHKEKKTNIVHRIACHQTPVQRPRKLYP